MNTSVCACEPEHFCDACLQDSETQAQDTQPPYVVRPYSFGGMSGYHDWLMSDGTILTMSTNEAINME